MAHCEDLCKHRRAQQTRCYVYLAAFEEQLITCEIDGANRVDVVMDIRRVGPSLSTVLPGELGPGSLQANPQAVPAAHMDQHHHCPVLSKFFLHPWK